MLVKNPKFEISAVSPKQYPKNNLPEIVLVGKSNVGKSSFIILMKLFILLIYLVMVIVKCQKKNKNKLENL